MGLLTLDTIKLLRKSQDTILLNSNSSFQLTILLSSHRQIFSQNIDPTDSPFSESGIINSKSNKCICIIISQLGIAFD